MSEKVNESNKIYQYNDGTYLPDSSQPNSDENYRICAHKYTPHLSTRYMNVTIGANGKAVMKNKKGEIIETDKDLPEIYSNRENCCGCSACYAICPVKAISMLPDEEGFLYPVVDALKCIRCYQCLNVCAFKIAQKEKEYLK